MAEARKAFIVEADDDMVDEVIAAAGGDPREAIRALIRGQDAIRAEVLRHVSPGYVRQKPQ